MIWNRKLYNYRVVDSVKNYNFRIDRVNIRGLKTLDFKIYKHKAMFWDSKPSQLQSCRFGIMFMFIRVFMNKLLLTFG